MKRYIKTICFSMMLMFSTSAMAQNKVVTGTVIDDLGEPVIGATVRVEGTKIATVTDFDGNYKIEVPEKGKIVISYIGYKDATTTGGRLQLESDSNDLEEVVVVGYGTQKKAHLTGSVGTVDMNDAAEITAGSLGATLSGLVNGLSVDDSDSKPGARAELYIRDAKSQAALKGYNATTNGSTEPLYVIDGYIYPNDVKVGNDRQNLGAEAFSNLDASEVESISVLKDAAAAVYGARAANGVILVTTKKGKLGAPRISYSGSFGITNEVSRPKMLSAYNFGRLYNIITARDPKNASLSPQSDLFQADELEAMKSLNYDLLDKYWKTGYTMKHSVNVSGATDNVSYFGGIGYFKQDGNLGNLDYDRWNYRAGMDVKISKWLSANINISGDYGKKNSPYISDGQGGDDYYRLLYRPTYYPEYVNGHQHTQPQPLGGTAQHSCRLHTAHGLRLGLHQGLVEALRARTGRVSGFRKELLQMSSRLTIANWAEDDQPREKLRDKGAQALSNAELLAILIGSGSPGVSAVELMQQVLNDCKNNLNTMGKMSIRQLMDYKGIGEAKAITILAACELGKRRQEQSPLERPDLGTATRIYNYMRPKMQDLDTEEFWVLLLNQNYRLIKDIRISHGGISEVSVDVRIIMREAVLANATVLAVCHNHPSGSISPSRQDDQITQTIHRACDTMRLHFLDHLIITDGQYFSYHESGKV